MGILYTEVISLPILVTPSRLLNWNFAATVQRFAFSFVMHAVWGAVLGAITAFGLGSARRQSSIRLSWLLSCIETV